MELEIQKGFRQTEMGLIPEDWNVFNLGEVGEVQMCKRIFSYQTAKRGDVPFYKIGTFGKKPDAFITKELYNEFRKKYSFPKKGYLLISASGTIGRTVKYLGEDAYYQDSNIIWIDNDESLITNEYLNYVLKIIKYNTEGSTIKRLYNSIIKSSKFVIPPTLTEQKAIATALSDVDALITSLDQLITKKKAIKQGAMQELLTPPHKGGKRLDGFDGGWEDRTIASLVKNKGLIRGPFGGALKKEFFVPNGYKVYEQKNAIYKSIDSGKYFIDDNKFSELKRFEIQANDFILSCSGTIGKMYQIPTHFKNGIINQALLIIRIDNTVSDYRYFEHQFTSDAIQKNVIDDTQGGAMKNLIGMSDFKRATIPYPPTMKEQKAIAQILSDMDIELEALATKKQKYQQLKQGMMQELLTGKTRLV